jgi:hypothetical protein
MAFAGGLILARVALAGVDGDVTTVAGVAGLAKAGVVSDAGFVLAHGTIRTGVGLAVSLLDLAVDAGVAFLALAPVKKIIKYCDNKTKVESLPSPATNEHHMSKFKYH